MKTSKYLKGVLKTESNDFNAITNRIISKPTIRLLHAAFGMVTEAAEVADILKKHIFYGKDIDKTHLMEEVGDLFWYVGIALDVLDLSFETVMKANNKKLKKRYGEKFSKNKALNRKLDEEYDILKSSGR